MILHARLHIAYIERPQAMKTKSVLGSCILALLAAASVAAYAQMRTAETAGAQNTGDIVDAKGNLRVPADYRTAYQFLGSWAVAEDQGQGSKEIHSFTRRRARSLPIAKVDGSLRRLPER